MTEPPRSDDYRRAQREFLRKKREHLKRLESQTHPDPGFDSWVDYATRHLHTNGADGCWQCVARRKALAELEQLQNRVKELEAKDV